MIWFVVIFEIEIIIMVPRWLVLTWFLQKEVLSLLVTLSSLRHIRQGLIESWRTECGHHVPPSTQKRDHSCP
jgi:hypothetical protein